jgi:hypothetical protein
LLFLCFGFGLLSVVLQDRGAPAPPRPTAVASVADSPRTPAPAGAAGEAILVLGVDDLSRDHPRLLALWLVAHDSTQDLLLLYGIPISAVAEGDERTLAALFDWSGKRGLPRDFERALASLAPLSHQAVVVMDEHAFASAVDVLGGVDLGGTLLDGEQVLAFLRLLQAKPEALLAAQAELLLALRPALQDLGPTPDISELEQLHPKHVALSLKPQQLAALVAPMLPFEAGAIRVGTLLDQPAP